jgi:hypothetical protein
LLFSQSFSCSYFEIEYNPMSDASTTAIDPWYLVQSAKWHGRPARENHAQDARATSYFAELCVFATLREQNFSAVFTPRRQSQSFAKVK